MPIFTQGPKSKSGPQRPTPESFSPFRGIIPSTNRIANLANSAEPYNYGCDKCGDNTILDCAANSVEDGQPGCRVRAIREGLHNRGPIDRRKNSHQRHHRH